MTGKRSTGAVTICVKSEGDIRAVNDGANFVRDDLVVEELELYVEHLMEPIHCIRISSELATEDLNQSIYQQVALQAFGDKLLTTTKELVGPLPPEPEVVASTFNAFERRQTGTSPLPSETSLAVPRNVPSILLRLFDQCPSDPLQATHLETSVLLAVRDVLVREEGWTLWEVGKNTWTASQHKKLQEDLTYNFVQHQLKLGMSLEMATSSATGNTASVPYFAGEVSVMRFTKRVDVIREVDVTEKVLQQQEEKAFRQKQSDDRSRVLQTKRFFSYLCHHKVPLEKRLGAIQQWMEGIELQHVKCDFTDASGRTVLHWIVDWSEEAYPNNRLGCDLLRSHIFFSLELGISPLSLDVRGISPIQLLLSDANSGRSSKRPRALKYLQEAARRTRPTSSLPLENIVYESVAGKFIQCLFSATKPNKFFTLELCNSPLGTMQGTAVSGDGLFFGVMLYDLELEWKFPIALFPKGSAAGESLDMRFSVLPFSRESHATTEGDILLCSNGSFLSVDYTAAHPRVSVHKTKSFSFDIFGGEGEGFSCVMQWLPVAECSFDAAVQRERRQRTEKERAALRVARSDYLSSLAQEINELERLPELPRTAEELEKDSEDVFSEKFAERILLYPYGPTPVHMTGGSLDETADANESADHRRTPSVSRSESVATGGPSRRQRGVRIGGDLDIISASSKQFQSETFTPSASPTMLASKREAGSQHEPVGVLCLLRKRKLVSVPLTRFALTTHATASLAERVQKLAEAVDALMSFEDTNQYSRRSNGSNANAPSLFTPMAQRGYGASGVFSTPLEEGIKDAQFTPKSPFALSLTSPNDVVHQPLDNTTNQVLLTHNRVASVDLSMFTDDPRAFVTMSATPTAIQIGLPDGGVIEYTIKANQFTRILEENAKPRASTGAFEPLGGSDYPVGLVAVDGADHVSNDESDVVPTTVVWCGKDLIVRTVRSWESGRFFHSIRAEDRTKDQEVTSAALHPRQKHIVLFTRRGQLCYANLKTGAVACLCPIVLSEAEVQMRRHQMDRDASYSSSGVEVIRFNADGSLLMRYCPLYHSVTMYHCSALTQLIEKEENALVKSSNLICGFETVLDDDTLNASKHHAGGTVALMTSATADAIALKSVPKERLRGYLERLKSSGSQTPLQLKVDHAFFVVQAIAACPTFHANIKDGDGRNAPMVLASLQSGDILKDTLFQYWQAILDDGGSLYQCSDDGQRAVSQVEGSTMHLEALLAYLGRQKKEIADKENLAHDVINCPIPDREAYTTVTDKPTVINVPTRDERPFWATTFVDHWRDAVFVRVVSSSPRPSEDDGLPSRLYSFKKDGSLCVSYLSDISSTKHSQEFVIFSSATDRVFAVCPIAVAVAPRDERRVLRDMILLPSNTMLLVEHPSGGGIHRPVTTIRPLVNAHPWKDRGLFSFTELLSSSVSFQIEAIVASIDANELQYDEVTQQDPNDESLLDPNRDVLECRYVGQLSFMVRQGASDGGRLTADSTISLESSVLGKSTIDSSGYTDDPLLPSLRAADTKAMSMSSSLGSSPNFGGLMTIPLILSKRERTTIIEALRVGGDEASVTVLDAISSGFDRGRSRVKQTAVMGISHDCFSLETAGPFAVFAYKELQSNGTRPRGGSDSPGPVVMVADASDAYSVMPSWHPIRFVCHTLQVWPKAVTVPSGAALEVKPHFDLNSKSLWLAICGADLCLAEIDWLSRNELNFSYNPAETALSAKVHSFVDGGHLPVGETIRCSWTPRSLVSATLLPDRGNLRTMTSTGDTSTECVRFRSDDEESSLLLLVEGNLSVFDVFVRKSISIVATAPMDPIELERMQRDSDIPEECSVFNTKVLCGGLNSIRLTPEGFLIRHNELYNCVVAVDWRRLMRSALVTAVAPDEYGHVAGGIPSRTLVLLPSTLFSRAGDDHRNHHHQKQRSALPEEVYEAYHPPLRFESFGSLDLVATGLVPPRTTRLKGYLSTQDVGANSPAAQALLLRLLMDAIESGCASPSQRDLRGRTAFHVFADLFAHLTVPERIGWLDRLIFHRCSLFACDAMGCSVLDRSEIRTFLFDTMGTVVPQATSAEDKAKNSMSYAALFGTLTNIALQDRSEIEAALHPDEEVADLTVRPKDIELVQKPFYGISQLQWSKNATGILYALGKHRTLYRICCHTGKRDVLLQIPENEWSIKNGLFIKVTAMNTNARHDTEADDVETSMLPTDHQPTDIILVSNGVVVWVYDPDGDAACRIEASGGPQWCGNTASSFSTDPIAPSQLRQYQSSKNVRSSAESVGQDVASDTVSTGLSPLPPSTSHSGIEVKWFVAAGEELRDPSQAVALLVMACHYHTVNIVRLYPPRGVTRIFPRHLTAMLSFAQSQLIPIQVPLDNEKSSPLFDPGEASIERYESVACGDAASVSLDDAVPRDEVSGQRHCSITHVERSPFGEVFFVVTQRGFDQSGASYVHLFSSPLFAPLGMIKITSPFALDLHQQFSQTLQTSGFQSVGEVGKQHMWTALQRQLQGAVLTLTDRSVAWCEGGGGLAVAKWVLDSDVSTASSRRAVLLCKGDHLAQRVCSGVSERITTDVCSPGYHDGDRVHISVNHGRVYSFNVVTGEELCLGALPLLFDARGDLSVSLSRTTTASALRNSSRNISGAESTFVAVHNLRTEAFAIFSYHGMVQPSVASLTSGRHVKSHIEAPRNLFSFLHFTPIVGRSQCEMPKAEERPVQEDCQQISCADTVELNEPCPNGTRVYSDPLTIASRNELRAILDEQLKHDLLQAAQVKELSLACKALMAKRKGLEVAAQRREQHASARRAMPKEWLAEYWQLVSMPKPFDGACILLCRSLGELRTLERLYVTMFWLVARGALALTSAVDRDGRTVAMYLAWFYSSYFSIVDKTPKMSISAKVSKQILLRWDRMKEEWMYLLRAGASIFKTDRFGNNFDSVFLNLHPTVGALLRSLAISSISSHFASENLTAEKKAVEIWREHQRRGTEKCSGQYFLGGLRDENAEVTVRLVKHSPWCCGRGYCFVAPEDNSNDELWAGKPEDLLQGEIPQEQQDSEVVLIQFPWMCFGALLITPTAVVACQVTPPSSNGGGQSFAKAHRSSSVTDTEIVGNTLKRANPNFLSSMNLTANRSLINRFTVKLEWVPSSTPLSVASAIAALISISHWIDVSAESTTFQFAGIAAKRFNKDNADCWVADGAEEVRVPFLRMWHCPTNFLKTESLSSLARYLAVQLQRCVNATALHPPAGMDQSSIPRQSLGCIAGGHVVYYSFGSSIYATTRKTVTTTASQNTEDFHVAAEPSKLLKLLLTLTTDVAALVSLELIVDLPEHPAAVAAPAKLFRPDLPPLTPHNLTRCSLHTILLSAKSRRHWYVLHGGPAMGKELQHTNRLLVVAKIPLYLPLRSDDCRFFSQDLGLSASSTCLVLSKCLILRTNTAAMHNTFDPESANGEEEPATVTSQLLALYSLENRLVVPVLFDVSDSSRCGNAKMYPPWSPVSLVEGRELDLHAALRRSVIRTELDVDEDADNSVEDVEATISGAALKFSVNFASEDGTSSHVLKLNSIGGRGDNFAMIGNY